MKRATLSNAKRIDALSGMKLCLQIWIISHHLLTKKSHPWFGALSANCPAALTAFFVISGFCNEIAYGDTETRTYNPKTHTYTHTNTKLNIIPYYIRRYFAFFPVYWIALITAICVTTVMKGLPFYFSLFLNKQFISVATMTWTWHSKYHKFTTWIYNGALWYMSTVSFCWFIYPVLRYVLIRVTRNHVQTTITLISSLLLSITPSLYLICRTGQIPPFYGGSAFGYWYVNPWIRLPCFWLGMVLCKAYKTDYLIIELQNSASGTDKHVTKDDCTNTYPDVSITGTYSNIYTPPKRYLNSESIKTIMAYIIYNFINIMSGIGILYVHGYMPQMLDTVLKSSILIWTGTAPLFAIFIYTCCIPYCRYSPFVNLLSAPVCIALVPGATIGFVYIFQTPAHYLFGGDFLAKILFMWFVSLGCNYHIFTPLDTYIKKRLTAKTIVSFEKSPDNDIELPFTSQ